MSKVYSPVDVERMEAEVSETKCDLALALVELAALKKRLADARTISLPNVDGWFLLVAMNDGEIKEYIK